MATPTPLNPHRNNADLMRQAYELAPYISDALREMAGEAQVPDTDEREWTDRQHNSRSFAVDLAESIVKQDATALDMEILETLEAHAIAARDEADEMRAGV